MRIINLKLLEHHAPQSDREVITIYADTETHRKYVVMDKITLNGETGAKYLASNLREFAKSLDNTNAKT